MKVLLNTLGIGRHDRKYSIDWSKIKNELGWSPLHSFDEWLGKTIEWYKENQKWWERVKSGDYQKYYKSSMEPYDPFDKLRVIVLRQTQDSE